jgi:hypothetical protein
MPPTERWRRFALMDVMVLVLCCGLGMAVARINQDVPAWRRFVFGLLLGLSLAVPALVASQRWFRGRREPLGPGERMGLIPLVGILGIMAIYILAGTPIGAIVTAAAFLWISLQIVFGALSVVMLLFGGKRRESSRSRPWTEWLGLIVCALFGGMIAYSLFR